MIKVNATQPQHGRNNSKTYKVNALGTRGVGEEHDKASTQ